MNLDAIIEDVAARARAEYLTQDGDAEHVRRWPWKTLPANRRQRWINLATAMLVVLREHGIDLEGA